MRQDPNITPARRYLGALDNANAVIVSRSASQQLRALRKAKAADAAMWVAAAATVIGPFAALAIHGRPLADVSSDTAPDPTLWTEWPLFVLTALIFLGPVVGLGAGWVGGRIQATLAANGLLTRDFDAAPVSLRAPMRAALGAADTIADSLAVRDGWLDDLDLNPALWDLAQHLKAGSRLHELLANRRVDAADADKARAELVAAVTYMQSGADRLIALARSVAMFDEEFAAASDPIDLDDYARLSLARTDLIAIERAVDNTADVIAGKLDAYRQLSGRETGN